MENNNRELLEILWWLDVSGFNVICAGSGECLTCGDNKCGQLGYRRERDSKESLEGKERQPAMVTGLVDKEVERVACGDLFTIACCKSMDVHNVIWIMSHTCLFFSTHTHTPYTRW